MRKIMSQVPATFESLEDKVQKVLGKTHEDKEVEEVKVKEEENRLVQLNLVAVNIADKLEASLKPRGFYNIPDILDERRLYYGIPNGAFECYPAFDKVFVYQIPLKTRKTYAESGAILRPDQVNGYDRNTTPRGIIVSAGLKAMDALYSTGFHIGEIIRFKKLSPYMMPIDDIDGHEFHVMVIRDGDIEASEDFAEQLNNRKIEIKNVKENGYDFRVLKDGKLTGQKVEEYYDPSM